MNKSEHALMMIKIHEEAKKTSDKDKDAAYEQGWKEAIEWMIGRIKTLPIARFMLEAESQDVMEKKISQLRKK